MRLASVVPMHAVHISGRSISRSFPFSVRTQAFNSSLPMLFGALISACVPLTTALL